VAEVQQQLDPQFVISAPNFGDGEIREIDFSHPDIRLRIFLPVQKRMVSILMIKATFFSLVTDHPQNVIESIAVYQDRETARAHDALLLRCLPDESLRSSSGKLLVVRPIAGANLICECEDLKMSFDEP
jgi:hypothetical protein